MVHSKKLKRKVKDIYKKCLSESITFKDWADCRTYVQELNMFNSKTIINWCTHVLYKESRKKKDNIFEIYLQKIMARKQKLIRF